MTDKTASAGAPVVRFAPSPTGYLHIGGARTALFNWLYAKGRGGKMLLRIEDTDRERNNPEAVAAIVDGLKWLELNWDGDTVSQFARAHRHRQVAEELLASGHAYKCWLTPAELDAMREKAQAEKRRSPSARRGASAIRPRRRPACRTSSASRRRARARPSSTTRCRAASCSPNKELDDLIILRSDGNPTYNLAVVVDDHDMQVTHIIRGVDHLTNAARQTQIYQAMDWDVPIFAHVPLIHGPDGAKLSKRHGALGIEAYKEMGYLPAALRNYLVRLGWSHGNDEIMSTSQMLDWFDTVDINRSAARFDFAKLEDLNGHYIRHADDQELLLRIEDLLPYLPGGAAIVARLDANMRAKFLLAMPGLKERAKTLVELVNGADYLFADRPLALDDKAQKLLDAEGRQRLADMLPKLEAAGRWKASELEEIVRSYAEASGAKLGKVAQPLRAALTGKSVSPPVFDVMAVLGRDEALARIRDQAA